MDRQVFVARERELAQLDGFLKRALAAQGLVCFISGEAGSGKTALITEFARLAQKEYADLVVAVGQSDAQTGVGDAYLPFREILGQLTGDVEAKLAQGTITPENAGRLRKLLVLSGQALLEAGPDLIGVFVPGAGVATRVAAFAVQRVGWLEKLEDLISRRQQEGAPQRGGIDQNHIFEQYTNVLTRLAGQRPLLLVLDDLQWADAASLGLLFRLGRRVGGSRILIVGTYRPEEVALGREGERHPLERVLAELKRSFGNVWVDLDRRRPAEGEGFVDALLDTESNRLTERFRRALYKHTSGHPLFTIELLRALQERGDLVLDAQGRWVEGPQLAWETLPVRVEGVIEERIGRLEQELREVLTVGSVEGESFAAELVARVQSTNARRLIRRLSQEVERLHRLVVAQGVQRLDATGQRLSRYRFQHNLFQSYLYHELDAVERVILHEEIGCALEELYGTQVDEVAVQLAWHFEEAGVEDRARHYLHRAGEQAAVRYANQEAIGYLSRALELAPEEDLRGRFDLLLAREEVYELQGDRDAQARDLASLQALAEALGDDRRRAKVALRQAHLAESTGDYHAAIESAQKAIPLARQVEAVDLEARGHFEWGTALLPLGEKGNVESELEAALALAREAGLRQVEALSVRNLGLLAVRRGNYDLGRQHYSEALRIFREIGDRRGESGTLNNLGVSYDEQGEYAAAREYYQQALPVFREMGDRRCEAIVLGNLGVVSARQGDLDQAKASFEQSRLVSHEIGDRDSEGRMLGNLGALCTMQADFSSAQQFFEQSLEIYRDIDRPGDEGIMLYEFGKTLIAQGNYAAARDCSERSLQIAREVGDPRSEANVLRNLGVACHFLGDLDAASAHYEASLDIARRIGHRKGESSALTSRALLHHHLGQDRVAQEDSLQSLHLAQELGDPDGEALALTHLGHALSGLDRWEEAASAYQDALAKRRELGQLHLAAEPLAWLARVSLAQGDLSRAGQYVEEILTLLEESSLDGTEEPFRVYLTCYRVLRAREDPRAEPILATAHRKLQARAARIEDEVLRSLFLENVAAHREVLEEYAAGELEGMARSNKNPPVP